MEEQNIPNPTPEEIEPLVSWQFPEKEAHTRSKNWYVSAGVIMTGLLIFAIWQDSYLFALILILATIIFLYNAQRETRTIKTSIDELGIVVDDHFFSFKDFSNFWIAYNPPVEEDVYLNFKDSIKPHLILPLNGTDPLTVREILLPFIKEDLEKEEGLFSELLRKRLKL